MEQGVTRGLELANSGAPADRVLTRACELEVNRFARPSWPTRPRELANTIWRVSSHDLASWPTRSGELVGESMVRALRRWIA